MGKKLRGKNGMTLMEALAAAGILCVAAVIVIPSLLMIFRTLEFQKRNNYARAVFLAAQTELVEMRSRGELAMLKGDAGAIRQHTDAEGIPPSGYVYTYSDANTFGRLLPAGSIEETVLAGQILIEYSPGTGNVYSVFYYEGREDIVSLYEAMELPRDPDQRRKQKLGYYDGSDLTDPDLGVYHVEADIFFENGQEGIVTVAVPTQAVVAGEYINFMGDDYGAYASGLEVNLIVTGEQGGTFTKKIKTYGEPGSWTAVSGEGGVNTLCFSCPLDSLRDQMSFASLAENDRTPGSAPAPRTLTEIPAGDYVIQPGDNISITAEVTFRPGMDDPLVIIESAVIAGVNPMFASLTPGTGGYILTVSNGRNLQNLNAIAPEIAKKVEAVVFSSGPLGKPAGTAPENIIDWNDTVAYYNRYASGDGTYRNSPAEAPARQLPYFVPIHNEYLFGTARFGDENGRAALQEINRRNGKQNADIVGNNVKICGLNIDTGQYATNQSFYAGSAVATDQKMAGLFGFVNAKVDGVWIVNPVIHGRPEAKNGQRCASAAGALIGAAGKDTAISHCGVYIDTTAGDFLRDNLNMDDFSGAEGQYGVSGYGAVGGLVGFMNGGGDNGATVQNSFCAVPVFGVMRDGDNCGCLNGVGGLVGNAQLVSFSNCYASGYTGAEGCAVMTGVVKNTAGITVYGSGSTGVGGFVGTSHGCRYTDCFASGNVRGTDSTAGAFAGVLCCDSFLGTGKTKLSGCYGAGTVSGGGYEGHFWGAAAILNPAHLPAGLEVRNCYYLSPYLKQQPLETETAAGPKPVTFGALGNTQTPGFETWTRLPADHTHGYLPEREDNAYPFVIPSGFTDYYGLWPVETVRMLIAYYETYGEDGSGETGFYIGDGYGSTLKEAPVADDGYVILSASESITAKAGGSVLPLERLRETVVLDGSAYYVFRLPLDVLAAAAGEVFYAEVTLETGGSMPGEARRVYVNPDVALGHVNTADQPPALPEVVYIRSARQLAAMGSAHMKHFLQLSYQQKTDIDLSGTEQAPIHGFTGTYDGGGRTIAGLDHSLFAENAGTIRNLHLQTQEKGNLAQYNSGTITACTVVGSGAVSVSGLVNVNRGTITDCAADVSVVADGSAHVGILVGQMLDGSIRGCSVSGVLDARGCGDETAAGGVVGYIEGGTLSHIISHGIVRSGDNGNIGSFGGAADGGMFLDCHTKDETNLLPFIGYVKETASERLHGDATHWAAERWPDGTVSWEEAGERFHSLEGLHHTKPEYAATFENCTFCFQGTEASAMGKTYYYQLTPIEGYKMVPLRAESGVSQTGKYVLVTEDHEILTFTEGGTLAFAPYTDSPEISGGMIWSVHGETWSVEKTAVVQTVKTEAGENPIITEEVTEYKLTAAVNPEDNSPEGPMAVTVDYTITAVVTQTQTVGTEAPVVGTETKTAASGRERCFLYEIGENTGYKAICVDTRIALAAPES